MDSRTAASTFEPMAGNGQSLDPANGFFYEPAYDLLNVKLAWDNIFSSSVGVAAFCNNVTDKLYRVGVISLQSTGVGYTGDVFGDPRTYGMEVNYKFGR